MKYSFSRKITTAICVMGALSVTSSAYAAHVLNANQGTAVQVQSCTLLSNGNLSVTDMSGNTSTLNNYGTTNLSCAIMPPQDMEIVDAIPSDFAQPAGEETGSVSFEEALSVCRKNRGDNLQACIDKKTGQRNLKAVPAERKTQ